MLVWKCVKDFLLFVQICLSRRGLKDLGYGGLPLLVVHVGRSKRYTLRLVEVEGEWGPRDLLLLMLRGDRRHRRVLTRLWTRHSTSMSNIIRSSLNFSQVISIKRGMSITRGIRLSFTRGISLSSLLSSSMSSLLSNSIMSSILSSSSMQSLLWRTRMGAFRGALWDVRCHFYRTSVNTWHAGFGTIKQ